MRYKTITALAVSLALAVALGTSCSSGTGTYESNYRQAQVVDVFGLASSAASLQMPSTAVIQPKDLVMSPAIDIATLKATDGKTARVISETQASSLAEGEVATSSGDLAVSATQQSMEHVRHASDFYNSIAEYDWTDGRIYEVITSPRGITDLRLQPGESIMGEPAITDPGMWLFSMGTSVEDGTSIQHLFIRPVRAGLDTYLTILTNKRTYYLRIASFEEKQMAAVRFRYPVAVANGWAQESDVTAFLQEQEAKAYPSVDLATAVYDYEVRITKGKPAWKPQSVFSDSVRTFIQFPPAMMGSSDLPALYVVRSGKADLVNYRMIGNFYVTETILPGPSQYFLLKSGEGEQVRILRTI